jgi:hypothetical protein
MAIVSINVGGFFFNFALMDVIMAALTGHFYWMWCLFEFSGLLINICSASNAPILYWMRLVFYP